jgi:hypothetical protein
MYTNSKCINKLTEDYRTVIVGLLVWQILFWFMSVPTLQGTQIEVYGFYKKNMCNEIFVHGIKCVRH